LLKLVITYPGSTPGHLAEVLALAPSTVTRFADALQRKGLIERQSHGKQVSLHATAAGEAKRPAINAATDRLMAAFTQTLGLEGTTTLTGDIANAIDAIEGLIGDPERLAALSASAVATTASETADSG
jgi:DNA-binding MarR family transcriptional regulator